jgi:RNA polymerase sigma-70 factor (ECF subfamily)
MGTNHRKVLSNKEIGNGETEKIRSRGSSQPIPCFSCRILFHAGVSKLTGFSSISADELVRACAESNDGAAWDEFVFRFHRAISLSIMRIAYQWGQAPRQLVDDLVQETYLKLCSDKCRLLLEFAAQHPEAVPGYIKMIAVNVARDYFKSVYSQKRGAGQTQESLAEVDPKAETHSLGGQGAMERQILLKQIDECLGTCSTGLDQERDRLIFWLYYQQGLSAQAIAALPTVGLTAKGVESAILRLTRLVRQQMVKIHSEPSGGSESSEKGFRPAESY